MGDIHTNNSLAVFRRIRLGLPPAVHGGSSSDSYIRGVTEGQQTLRALGMWNGVFRAISVLRLDLRAFALLSVTGGAEPDYSLAMWSRTASHHDTGAAPISAEDVLELDEEHGLVRVNEVPGADLGIHEFYIDVRGPADIPLVIHGVWSAIDVAGMRAPVEIDSSHGRVSILDCSGDVSAVGREGAHLVWAGCRGRIELACDSVDIMMTSDTHEGRLRATAAQRVRVFTPVSFRSGIEVSVRRDDCFVRDQPATIPFRRVQDRALVTFTMGPSPPVVHISAQPGSVELAHFDSAQRSG